MESEEQTKRNTEYSFKKYSFKKKYKGFFKSFENMPVRKIENWCQKRKYSVDLLDAIALKMIYHMNTFFYKD